MQIKKIYIASDVLFTNENVQFSNRRWMKDLLTRPITKATGVVPESFFSSVNAEKNGAVSRTEFFKRSNIECDLKVAQFNYDVDAISYESLAYLNQFIDESTLIIGHETTKQTREIYRRLNVPFVDMWLSPLRFLDDTLFSMNSSNAAVNERIFSYHLDDEIAYIEADRLKIQTYRGWRRVEADIVPNSALFAGQMMNDKSVCDVKTGKFLSVLDFKEKFEKLGEDYNKVYYAKHPYLRSGDEEINEYLATLPFVEFTTIPTYRMLASHRIQKVASLSSSVLTEATYFGKETECFFKPVMTINDETDIDTFANIYQDFVFADFWADILSPIMFTNEVKKVRYLTQKDKIRDMIGAYYAHADIDKTEHMRQQIATLNNKSILPLTVKAKETAKQPTSLKTRKQKNIKGFAQSQSDYEAVCKQIDKAEVVSFDIFDTLIERVIDNPNDLFDFMSAEVQKKFPQITDFKKARLEARKTAKKTGEEVLLKDRYDALAAIYGLTEDEAQELHDLELKYELKACVKRFWGNKLLSYAKSQNKKIILVSDIFFERDFIEKLLNKVGITSYDTIFLSSEEGKLKHTGNLFHIVLDAIKTSPESVLHIGDNKHSDIEQARKHNMKTHHMMSKSELLRKTSHYDRLYDNIDDKLTRSAVKGLVSRDFTSNIIIENPAFTQSSPSVFGYNVLGTMMFGFAKHILDKAMLENIEDIYFLARDGDIVKRVYDIIAKDVENAPKSHYIYASRRSVRVATLETVDDILAALETNFTPISIAKLVESRFGINAHIIEQAAYADHNFLTTNAIADYKKNKEDIISFFSDERVSAYILANAREEARELTAYYESESLTADRDPSKLCFVDIGHAGTIQKGICDLLGYKDTLGLYFATDISANEVLENHRFDGYAEHLMSSKRVSKYRNHLLMFELVFLNTDSSFVCIRDGKKVFLRDDNDEQRKKFIREAHFAAELFANDIVKYFDNYLDFTISGKEAILAYDDMLTYPEKADITLFDDIVFENTFSCRDERTVVRQNGIWQEASMLYTQSVADTSDNTVVKSDLLKRIATKCIRIVQNDAKADKFYRSPKRYFADAGKIGLAISVFM